MNKRIVLALSIFLMMSFFSSAPFYDVKAKASNTLPVHNVNTGLNYTSIQEAISASETVNGHIILVEAGTYFENVVIYKSLAIIGEGGNTTVIDGGRDVIIRINVSNVLVRGFAMRNGFIGIHLDHSNNSSILENTVSGVLPISVETTAYAIYASYSSNFTIAQNEVLLNDCSGILVTNSVGFMISHNSVHDNAGYGINTNASMNGWITENDAFENSYDGIGLGEGSSNCTVTENNVTSNGLYGVWIDTYSVDNTICGNNIINNNKQAQVNLANRWDNGVEGNYWSDYAGFDGDRNGIGDTPYTVEQNNTDNYPLMGPLSVYATSRGSVSVASNSSITSFAYYESNGSISMRVLNKTEFQTGGFCRIHVPHALMTEPYNVTVDGSEPSYSNSTLYDDGSSRWIYVSYQHSEREVLIQGTPPPANTGSEEPFPYWIAVAAVVVAVAMIIGSVFALRHRRKRA